MDVGWRRAAGWSGGQPTARLSAWRSREPTGPAGCDPDVRDADADTDTDTDADADARHGAGAPTAVVVVS